MRLSHRIILAACVFVAGCIALFTWLHKTVELVIDSEHRKVATYALTMRDFLRSNDIALTEADLISPDPSHWLEENEVITIQRAAQVPILADGKVQVIFTAATAPAYILTQAGISFSPADQVLADGETVRLDQSLSKDPHTHRFPALQLRRASSYSLQEGEQEETFASTAATLAQALCQAGVPLTTADQIDPPPGTPLADDMEVFLQRARSITITRLGVSTAAQVAAVTVAEALAKAGFPLQALDYSLPPEDTPIPADGKIHVVYVREETIIEQTPLPFEEEFQAAADLEIDRQMILQAGEYGISARRIRVRYEDEQEVSRQAEDEWIARQPQNRIIGYGTKLVEQVLDTPDGTFTYWRSITMYAVSYSPSSAGGSVTASGARLQKGLVAVDTRYIPLGTRLYIPGYGEALAADTGGGVKGRIIDLGYSDEDYVAWHQNVTVYFLSPPPPTIVWIFP